MANLRPDQLGAAVDAALKDYANRVSDNVGDAVKKMAKVACAEVKRNAAEHWGKTEVGKKYIRGWTTSFDTKKRSKQGTVYNRLVPGLPHLLEFDHAKRNGGRTQGTPHIMPVMEWVDQEAELWIVDAIEEA